MKIKLRAGYASAKGTFDAGQTIEVDNNEGHQLIAGGYATPVGVAASLMASTSKAPETAKVAPAETRAPAPKKSKAKSARKKINPPTP